MKAQRIWLFLMHLFSHSCHQKVERSFFVHGYQCPVCARCCGVYLGYAIGIFMWACSITLPLYIYGGFLLLMLADWGLQAAEIRPSTNCRRLLTGTLCGIAFLGIFRACIMTVL
ncbi:DUF2085 domain-containing protein [[Clostridium] innocuum]|nr:DUF2085 domain-containing protein [[Clostridium] innocuum]